MNETLNKMPTLRRAYFHFIFWRQWKIGMPAWMHIGYWTLGAFVHAYFLLRFWLLILLDRPL